MTDKKKIPMASGEKREEIVRELEKEFGIELLDGYTYYKTREERRIPPEVVESMELDYDDDAPARNPFPMDNFGQGAIEGYVL